MVLFEINLSNWGRMNLLNMYKHSELGHASLSKSNSKVLHHVFIIIFEHHEKWDESGYPDDEEKL